MGESRLSICVIYSNDRAPQAMQAIDCLSLAARHEFKLLICDGPTNLRPYGFSIEEVPRHADGWFRRAYLWDRACAVAPTPNIFIMDCDRIVSDSFLAQVKQPDSGVFYFPAELYGLRQPTSTTKIMGLRNNPFLFSNSLMRNDARQSISANIGPGKNPMSGCVVFRRSTYHLCGGMSPEFKGWGYNDTDFFMKAIRCGAEFNAQGGHELHLPHGYPVSLRALRAMNAWNGVFFCDKWFLAVHPAIINLLAAIGSDVDEARATTIEEFVAAVDAEPA